MPSQSWCQTIASQQAVGTFFATYTTAKTVINPQALVVLPAGFFDVLGKSIRVDVLGAISNIVTTPGTITFQVMLGSVIAFTSGAIQMSTTAHTKLPFRFTAWLTARTLGSSTSANLIGMSEAVSQCFSISTSDATSGHSILQAPNTTPAVGTGFDSTAAQTLDFWTGFSISNAANGIEIHQYLVTSLN